MTFVCDDNEFSCRINNESSICTAELFAIEAAIEYICESTGEEAMIIADSLSSLQALKSQTLKNPIGSNILHMCHYLSRHKDIDIGIHGNNWLMFWPRQPCIRQNSFIIYLILILSILVYLDDILQGEWNINSTAKFFDVQPTIKRSFTPM